MQFSLEKDVFHYVIHSCSDEGILVNQPVIRDSVTQTNGQTIKKQENVLMKNSFIITADTLADWDKTHIQQITSDDIEQLCAYKPEILVLGTGATHEWPDMGLFEPLYSKNIGVEVMRTDAACRTYNLLMSDSRKVVAAMIVSR